MGVAPDQVGKMSLWQIATIVHGWNEAHADKDAPPPPMTDDEARELGII